MKLFDGLYSYEIVLMVLGVVLFVVILFAFVVLILRGKPFAKILGFFMMSLVMIGFPSIKSIEFSKGVLTIEKNTDDLQHHPTNPTLRDALANEVAGLSPRPSADPQVIATIARAQIALGRNDDARATIKKALQLAPQHPQVQEVQKRLELDDKLVRLATKAEQEPANSAAREELRTTLAEVSSRPFASPVTIVNVARGQAAIGDHTQALKNVEKALIINPNHEPAIFLKKKIGSL